MRSPACQVSGNCTRNAPPGAMPPGPITINDSRFPFKEIKVTGVAMRRTSDVTEVLDLVSVDQLGITNADQALEIYRTVLPHTAAVDARRRELVSKIVDERVRHRQ